MRTLIVFALLVAVAHGLVCCDVGESPRCAQEVDCPMVDRCGAAECGTTSLEGDLCGCQTPATPCNPACSSPCDTCVDGTCVTDPLKLDACGLCQSDCKVIAQGLALSPDHTFVADGIDIIAAFLEVAANCFNITIPTPNPVPCGANCRQITQNVALGSGSVIVANGTNLVDRLRELQMQCP